MMSDCVKNKVSPPIKKAISEPKTYTFYVEQKKNASHSRDTPFGFNVICKLNVFGELAHML